MLTNDYLRYHLLDYPSSIFLASRRLHCYSKIHNFRRWINGTAMKQDEHEYSKKGFWLVAILFSKYLASTYHSHPLPLVSPISDAVQSQRHTVDEHHQPPVDICMYSGGAHPIRTDSTMSMAAMRHGQYSIFISEQFNYDSHSHSFPSVHPLLPISIAMVKLSRL